MNTITDGEVDFYRLNGYLLCHRPLFAPERFERLAAIFEEHLANRGQTPSDQLDTPHFKDERLLEFLLSDEALDVVEPLIGPNIALWSSHFISKEPYSGRPTPWHEDSAYWKGRVDRYDQIVTIWLALDRSARHNGCMRVIPGTHHNGFSDYVELPDKERYTFGSQIKGVEEEKAVDFELERGEFSLHDARIMHGAEANTSPDRRCGYTLRYLSTATRVYEDKFPGFKIWLARGRDLAGNKYVNA